MIMIMIMIRLTRSGVWVVGSSTSWLPADARRILFYELPPRSLSVNACILLLSPQCAWLLLRASFPVSNRDARGGVVKILELLAPSR